MIHWEEKTLNELGIVARGKSRHRPRNAPHLYGGKYPLIQTGDVQSAPFYITSYSQTYSEDGLAQSKLWQKNTLCISIVGANTAATAILDFEACFPDSVIGFLANPKNSDVKFVKYSLELLRSRLKSISEGTARENLSLEKLLTIKIPTPSLDYQKKIVSILSPYDDLMQNNLKRINLIEDGLNKRFEVSYCNLRNTEIPILQIADFIKGYEPGTENYLEEPSNDTIPFLRVGDLNKRDSSIFINKELAPSIIAKDEDILLSLDGTVGLVKVGLYGAYSSGVRKVVSKSPEHKAYIYAYLKSQHGQNTIKTYARGSTILHAGSAIPKMKIRLPEKESMAKFSSFANPTLEVIINLMKQNKILQEARDILIPRLMTGMIEV